MYILKSFKTRSEDPTLSGASVAPISQVLCVRHVVTTSCKKQKKTSFGLAPTTKSEFLHVTQFERET
jgi:hypothetical protein